MTQAAELKMKLPRKTKPTPVQALNQHGVKALSRHNLDRARRDFYQAYLIDPDDPFTLNNLGYMAELDGDIQKAQRFYELSSANTSDATVALSTDAALKGKEVSQVAGIAPTVPMQVNRLNVAALSLMMKDRAPEAEVALRKALALDPRNPFTLNNLGYALEKEGDLEQAVHFYNQAALTGSGEKVVIAPNRSWRGRSISEIASLNSEAAERELNESSSADAQAARLALRGVAAFNRNQTEQARQFFQQAYRLDPEDAFSLNNMGVIAEMQGDRETAGEYYAQAREAYRSNARVALSSRRDMEGLRLSIVASTNDQVVDAAIQRQLIALRAQGGQAVPLRTRDQAFVREPASPPQPGPELPVRIVAEDNPPPEPIAPPAMAAPSRTSAPAQQQAQQPAQQQTAPQTSAPATTSQPLPTVNPEPDDNRPLLPVIPDP